MVVLPEPRKPLKRVAGTLAELVGVGAGGVDAVSVITERAVVVIQSHQGKSIKKDSMSELRAKLTEDMKNAMRAKDMLTLNTVRYLLSSIKNWEIDHGLPTDEDVVKIISKEVKQMRDAISEFARGGRQDLVEEEEKKVSIIERYLPSQLSPEELEKTVKEVMSELGESDFGKTMRAVMAKVQGKAEGSSVSAMVKKLMNS